MNMDLTQLTQDEAQFFVNRKKEAEISIKEN
jgi:hypothetical protein